MSNEMRTLYNWMIKRDLQYTRSLKDAEGDARMQLIIRQEELQRIVMELLDISKEEEES